ncbi:RidA family protein [Anaerorhabdus furcosa]|uniref:2-iminobutanoate/2-iminopropanoate deaminase n=1 Tax=Anaerorhabdus furcosa TaxID=118967 RepID=A0A1T4L8H1_9FIRM|nr:RidA family protein [Anaerorhabdus furcosa]SJZ50880.1 2-iminobutanoate/2-iminopropanoate deaminase [Anaerorhabdus furcosa]
MKEIVNTKNAPEAIGPYAQAIKVDGFLYTSGQLPIHPQSGVIEAKTIQEQATQVMENLNSILKESGFTLDDVIKTTCFLSTLDDFAAFNEVYGNYFTKTPARSCFAVLGIPKGALCEVEIIAHK